MLPMEERHERAVRAQLCEGLLGVLRACCFRGCFFPERIKEVNPPKSFRALTLHPKSPKDVGLLHSFSIPHLRFRVFVSPQFTRIN